ncbi:MAG: alkaline phosphatase D family protein [Caulobacteraceae bacterium]|nr:alkaline phosphatase D family protein [Caulobacteraceae bacterium]
MSVTRRSAFALAAGATAFLSARPGRAAEPVRFSADPFKLGVASGDPTADGFVIWTRLAPEPFEPDGGMGDRTVEVAWTIAEDDRFRTPVRSGTQLAHGDRGHAIHVELTGLQPGRPYWYRFEAGGVRSPAGRAMTLPALGSPLDRYRLAWVSCQHFEQGFFTAYRDMVAWDPGLILHLGDYIYESSFGQQIRRHPNRDPRTLDDYRVHHAVYKLDEDLQAAHRHTSWALIWDDHDVANDYAGLIPPNPADLEGFPARRAAGYQAWFENLPISRRSLVSQGEMRIYQQLIIGDLAQIALLDNRQYRSPRACVDPQRWRSTLKACPDNRAPGRTMLGDEQEHWLGQTLDHAPTRWNVIAQQTMFSPFLQKTAQGEWGAYMDGWSAYPAARQAILDRIAQRPNRDTVILGGDMHSYFAVDVHANGDDDKMLASPLVASEFVGGSVTTQNYNYERWTRTIAELGNQHIRFFDDRVHGWAGAEITPAQWTVDFRAVSSTWVRDPTFSSLSRWAVEYGKAGVQRI